MKAYFQDQTLRPEQAEIIYMDVAAYDNGYSIQGRYRRLGDQVEVAGRLFKGGKSKGNIFRVSGFKNDLPALVEKILETIWPLLEH